VLATERQGEGREPCEKAANGYGREGREKSAAFIAVTGAVPENALAATDCSVARG
jgi:hypothetical protein